MIRFTAFIQALARRIGEIYLPCFAALALRAAYDGRWASVLITCLLGTILTIVDGIANSTGDPT